MNAIPLLPKLSVPDADHVLQVHSLPFAFLHNGRLILSNVKDGFFTLKADVDRVLEYVKTNFIYLPANEGWVNPATLMGLRPAPAPNNKDGAILFLVNPAAPACAIKEYPSPEILAQMVERGKLTDAGAGIFFSMPYTAWITPEAVVLTAPSHRNLPVPLAPERREAIMALAEAEGWLPMLDGSYVNPGEVRVIHGDVFAIAREEKTETYTLSRPLSELTPVGRERLEALRLFDLGEGRRIHLDRAYAFHQDTIRLGYYISFLISPETREQIKAARVAGSLPPPNEDCYM